MIKYGFRIGVRCDNWRRRDGQYISNRLIRCVRHIHHHPQSIHFSHYIFTELAQSSMFWARWRST